MSLAVVYFDIKKRSVALLGSGSADSINANLVMMTPVLQFETKLGSFYTYYDIVPGRINL